MRVPTNSFDSSDLALCRAHGDAVFEHYPMPSFTAAESARFKAATAYRAACNDFERVTLDQAQSDAYWQWQHEVHSRVSIGVDLAQPGSDTTAVTLVPAKPASPNPEQAADVWHSEAPSVPGVYIASAERCKDVLSYWDGSKWHCGAGNAGDARKQTPRKDYPVEWLRLIEADAPAKPLPSAISFAPGDRIIITCGDDHYFFTGETGTVVAVDSDGDLEVQFDSNWRARKGPTCSTWFVRPADAARLAPTSSAADGAALVDANLMHSVCIKAHHGVEVGRVVDGSRPLAYPKCWLQCDKDGWIPHAAGDGCPAPVGVGCQLVLRGRTVFVDVSEERDFRTYGYWNQAGEESITHWRPIAKDAS